MIEQADWKSRAESRAEKAEAEARTWKANHDNQVELKRILMDRPDLKDRAKRMMDLLAKLEKAASDNTRLREALKRFGQHGISCAIFSATVSCMDVPAASCDCGLASALSTEPDSKKI